MREIGGYIELDRYTMPLLHEGAVALNCGRNALVYLIRAKKIRRIKIPRFLCDSVMEGCKKGEADVSYYAVGDDFLPRNVVLKDDEWLYLVNYYGQVDNGKIQELVECYKRVIVDNAQAYFQEPVPGVDTIYTCRKFFGVADGAFLYTDAKVEEHLEQDESFERMRFLLGRFERTASEFYEEYSANNAFFAHESLKRMSKLTENLLRGIDYEKVKRQRTKNFKTLHEAFSEINRLQLVIPEGAFMYPLYIENGAEIRKILQSRKIYIPTLWPDVFDLCEEGEPEYDMARNILPLPVDQRYDTEDMRFVLQEIGKCIS